MIKVTGMDGINYIIDIDGERYWPKEALKEAIGCKDDDIFGEIKKLKEERERYKSNCDYFAGIAQDRLRDRNKLELELREALGTVDEYADIPGLVRKLREERDQLKDQVRRLRIQANSFYGASCGYSEYAGNKAPAFLCNVISYSWNFGALDTPFSSQSIRVVLDLTPTANYKGTIDMEDLKRYIQEYGREKKLGVIESVDYQNAKVARAELAHLYKQVLGKEKLDRDLSPHEVMKAILDEYERREEFIRELSCSLGFGDPVVKPDNIDQKEKDILERIESLKSGVWPCENTSTFAEFLRKEFPKFCEKYNVVPLTNASIRDWLQYIFDVLSEWRGKYDSEWARVEKLIKEKRAVENALAELRSKIREIYRSVVDDEWNSLSYTSALNDINEEYKRVVHNFEERTADWRKAQQELDRYRLAVGSLLGIPKEARDDINAIERSFTFSKKRYKSLQEFRDSVCEILDIPSSMEDSYILKEIHDIADRYDELEDFRADICGILDIEGMLGTPKQNDKYILEQVERLEYRAATGEGKEDALAKDLCELRKNAIEDLKSRGFCFRPEEDETLTEIYKKLLKRYDWAYGMYEEQYRLRQCWHARWESEHERANGEHKRAEKLRSEGEALKNQVEILKNANDSRANAIVALQSFKNECRKLKEEKTKVISALGQDIWDDCLK